MTVLSGFVAVVSTEINIEPHRNREFRKLFHQVNELYLLLPLLGMAASSQAAYLVQNHASSV